MASRLFLKPALAFSAMLALAGCGGVKVNIFTDESEPLREYTLVDGRGRDKILVVPLRGFISESRGGLFSTSPSMVQELVSNLKVAEKDSHVKAVILKIDSPGGTATSSDILYHEILEFKARTGKKVLVCMMDVAASGGYYIALPADWILAHPTTVTGSVGVIFMRPRIVGLLDKIGVGVDVSKSGAQKDMGSPFRQPTPEEEAIFDKLIAGMGDRFNGLVAKHRPGVTKEALAEAATARVFLAPDALKLGLIDQVGYMDDAIAKAKELAGMETGGSVVVYRRREFADDNLYNNATGDFQGQGLKASLVDLGPVSKLAEMKPGFYYVWMPESAEMR